MSRKNFFLFQNFPFRGESFFLSGVLAEAAEPRRAANSRGRGERMAEKSRARRRILKGYDKLAFGGVADAVRLMFWEEPDFEQIGQMDLFNIAEIKRPKGGGMEIKFFDRIKALQCMEALDGESENGPGGFYRALEAGVRSFGRTEEE